MKIENIGTGKIFVGSTIFWTFMGYIKFYYIDQVIAKNDVDYVIEGVSPFFIPLAGLIQGIITTAIWKLIVGIKNLLIKKFMEK